jgi:hypothetical protein
MEVNMAAYNKIAVWVKKQLKRKTHISRFAVPNGILLSLVLVVVATGLIYVSYSPTSSKQQLSKQTTVSKKITQSTTLKSSSATSTPTSSAATTSTTPQTSTKPETTTPVVSTPQPVNQASIDATFCADDAGSFYSSLVSHDNQNSTNLVGDEEQAFQYYNNGSWSESETLATINQDITGFNGAYQTDYNGYLSEISPDNCVNQAGSALNAPQCTDPSDCVSQVPTR